MSGATEEVNVQGEIVKRMDIVSNETMIHFLVNSGQLCLGASEETEDVIRYELARSPPQRAATSSCSTKVHMRIAATLTGPRFPFLSSLLCFFLFFKRGTNRPAEYLRGRPPEHLTGEFVVTFDPLDGSSNIDAGLTSILALLLTIRTRTSHAKCSNHPAPHDALTLPRVSAGVGSAHYILHP